MQMISNQSQIWELKPELEDLQRGADYASITLPWTFNRMMLNTGSKGQQSRALNIAKGITAQEMLSRAFREKGLEVELERKSHRADDLFDFRVDIYGEKKKLDLKTVNYFSDYNSLGRAPLTPQLIIDNADYPGPDWRTFFPMLVPHTQIEQGKEGYCFAIASSIDFRNNIEKNREDYILTAFPFGPALPFLCSKKLCLEREESGKGFYISIVYKGESLFVEDIEFTVIGEWMDEVHRIPVQLENGVEIEVGPFSCVSSFQVTKNSYDSWSDGEIYIDVSMNNFKKRVLNSARRNINTPPKESLVIKRDDFCNLMLPSDYTLYVVGWTTKDEFIENTKKYTGWVWPKDSINKFENQLWAQITEKDMQHLSRAGFKDCIERMPSKINAGWLKTNGRGGGACCYYYPNIGMNGGVKETNLYVLPKDLYSMDSLLD
ncbi:hypothetical protein [Salirhabdus sp. Marseille-P4669]|uniref:hypothetical protein n=1 Tax=Salirhabdus sp. Marseille-P4669 TaxID=2042310 RepID=UPI000C7D2B99|nr:hypothetical protein [Salirhabdus sp. Marseille-P4669]